MPAAAVGALLEHCSTVLSEAAETLYEVLFSLAQDDWPQVSSFCQTWLRKHATDTMQVKSSNCLLPPACEWDDALVAQSLLLCPFFVWLIG